MEIVYNEGKMLSLMGKDRLISFMVKDLMKRGHDESDALEIVFNSEVLDGDREMQQSYKEVTYSAF